MKLLSRVRLFVTPWTVAYQAPPSMGFSRQKYWSGVPFLQCMKVKSESEVAQSCPTRSDPMDCSLPGYSIHGILQARVKEISPERSLEGLMLRLKLQYFGHLMRRADSLEKTLMLGKIEGRRRG